MYCSRVPLRPVEFRVVETAQTDHAGGLARDVGDVVRCAVVQPRGRICRRGPPRSARLVQHAQRGEPLAVQARVDDLQQVEIPSVMLATFGQKFWSPAVQKYQVSRPRISRGDRVDPYRSARNRRRRACRPLARVAPSACVAPLARAAPIPSVPAHARPARAAGVRRSARRRASGACKPAASPGWITAGGRGGRAKSLTNPSSARSRAHSYSSASTSDPRHAASAGPMAESRAAAQMIGTSNSATPYGYT